MHHVVEHGVELGHLLVRGLAEIVDAVLDLARREEILELRLGEELVAQLAAIDLVGAHHRPAQERLEAPLDLEAAVRRRPVGGEREGQELAHIAADVAAGFQRLRMLAAHQHEAPVVGQELERLHRRQVALVGREETADREILVLGVETVLGQEPLAVERGADLAHLLLVEVADRIVGYLTEIEEPLQQHLVAAVEGHDLHMRRLADIAPEALVDRIERPLDEAHHGRTRPQVQHVGAEGGQRPARHLAIEAMDGDDGALGGLEEAQHPGIGGLGAGAVEAGLELQENRVEFGDFPRNPGDFLVALAAQEGRRLQAQERDRETFDLDLVPSGQKMFQQA